MPLTQLVMVSPVVARSCLHRSRDLRESLGVPRPPSVAIGSLECAAVPAAVVELADSLSRVKTVPPGVSVEAPGVVVAEVAMDSIPVLGVPAATARL